MKTKLIILAAAAAAIVYSCSSDRDEDVRKEAIDKVKNNNQEKFKLNPKGITAKEAGEAKVDSIGIKGQNSTTSGPFNPDPNNGTGTDPDPIVDPTKPDKPW
ncbi:hypothetical protein [Chryseobacterium sp.]|uniref:hypothetical protein n=1 Tax=Chryseobacterium sp. TaxID=1871047 RepID=UPI00284F2E48|nr:hypothetical protein [Chryseobacterium sp.]MDR3026006.1 hypothetical protein [Chryseobacterium sp.]